MAFIEAQTHYFNMKNSKQSITLHILVIICLMVFGACSVKLATVPDMTNESIKLNYRVIKDVAYGSDKEQTLDIYLPNNAQKLGHKNFTVVFLHGGGYYISDKTKEERYIQPYLKKGMNVVNMNYRLKRGIPLATEDLTNALNFLKSNSATYPLKLDALVLTGFSAGAHIASLVGTSANYPDYPNKLKSGIKIAAVINFSGPVGGLDVVEKVFIGNSVPIMKEIGNALFQPYKDFAPIDTIKKYEPVTYFDKNDPPFFIWQGGKDDQVPPETFVKFVALLHQNDKKNTVMFLPNGLHSPSKTELQDAYSRIFIFLDGL